MHARVIFLVSTKGFELKQEAHSFLSLLLGKDFSLGKRNPLHDFLKILINLTMQVIYAWFVCNAGYYYYYYYCWRALARQHTILINGAKNLKNVLDVRLKACTVEYYPWQLKQQSGTHHMAVILSRIQCILSQQERDINQILLYGKICFGIHLSCQQRNSHIDNFWTVFTSRSSLDPLLITIYISPSVLYCNSRFLLIKDPYCCSYQMLCNYCKESQTSHTGR